MDTSTMCDPCISKGRENLAVNWCMECEEEICSECTHSHNLYKTLKSHHLVDLKEKISLSNVPMTCEVHPEKQLEYICTDHDHVCCQDCIAQLHKLCSNTMSVQSASENVKQSQLMIDCNQHLKVLQKTFEKMSANRKTNLHDLEKDGKIVKDQICKIKQEFIKRVDKIENTWLNEVDMIIQEQTDNMKKEEDEIDKIKEEIESNKREIEFLTTYGSNKNIFMYIRKVSDIANGMETDLQTMIAKFKNIVLTFKEINVPVFEPLVKVQVKEHPCTVTYTSPKQLQAQLSLTMTPAINTFKLRESVSFAKKKITSMSFTTNNALLFICDWHNHQVIVCDDKCRIMDTLYVDMQPWDITVIPTTQKAVVTYYSNIIQFLDTGKMIVDRKVDVGATVCGVSSTAENILLGSEGVIIVLDTIGNYLRTIPVTGCTLSNISCIHVGPKNRYYCCDSRQCVCLKSNGELIFSYSIQGESHHSMLETDRRGNVYIVGRSTSTVQRLHPNGTPDRVVFNKEDGMEEPFAICFNKTYGKVYISNYYPPKINVFDCE